MRTGMRRAFVALVAGLVLLVGSPASADIATPRVDPPAPAGGAYPVIVDDTGWQAEQQFGLDAGACGNELYGFEAGVNRRTTRTVTYANGDVKMTSRGSVRIRLVNGLEDGTLIGEAYRTVDGTTIRINYADGAVWQDRTGGQILAAVYSPVIFPDFPTPEADALLAAGLPTFGWIARGHLTEFMPADGSRVDVLAVPARVQEACAVLNAPINRDGSNLFYQLVGGGSFADGFGGF